MSITTHGKDRGKVGRPTKWRRVDCTPETTYFKPAAIPARILEEVCLSIEETEAIRLKDLEGLEQAECARRMNISRPTFHRILVSARTKIADALLNGKAIRIAGGNFEMAMRRFKCAGGHEWDVPFEIMLAGHPQLCPICDSPNILSLQPLGYMWRKKSWGKGCRRGRRDWQK